MGSAARAKSVRFDQDSFWVELSDGRTLGVPLAWFPRLLHGTPEQREQVTISSRGLHWEALAEDISIAGLLEGRGDQTRHHTVAKATRDKRSDGRADFMKRFFSVAVSVGFASKIGAFSFLSSFKFPNQDELHQLVLLVFAMTVVVGSWEFYFRFLEKRPLVDVYRFIIDIVIVSLYIVLLLSIRMFDMFLVYLDAIMLMYVVWDILSIRAFPPNYGVASFGLHNVISVYWNGALTRISHAG